MSTTVPARRPNLVQRALAALVLPRAITSFEASYLARMNRVALLFFWAHLPLMVALAYLNETGVVQALALTLAVLVGPTVASRALRSPRHVSMVHGFTAMCMGGVLVHVGQGPVQIEMHFYFFAALAMLALFANPLVIVTAAGTVAAHHLVLWFLAPASVFNYAAPLWVVLVHAAFVVLETVAACFIARNFFDNVIGLERIVDERTAEVRERNRDMRLVLDNVQQGFLTIDPTGHLSSERSSVVDTWFGGFEAGADIATWIGRSDARFGAWLALGLDSLRDGFMPLEVVLDQFPKQLALGGRHYSFEYRPILAEDGALQKLLVVVSDVTAAVERAAAEARQRETLAVFERILDDRAGFVEFHEECARLARAAEQSLGGDPVAFKRHVHTLKGNSSVFGLESIARQCHVVEERLAEDDRAGAEREFTHLRERLAELDRTVERLLGRGARESITMSGAEYEGLLRAVVEGADHAEIARRLAALELEPTEVRLARFADQARALARRLEKGDIEVAVGGNGLRLERERFAGFWSSFAHVLRNAVDHGLEAPHVRAESGKGERGRLHLATFEEGGEFVVEIEDDGRGIDWDAVRARAADLGLPTQSERDLVRALFAPGVSTAREVSEVSGRGIGLAAVERAATELGGRIAVRSERGRGTVLQFRFPAAVAAVTTNRLARLRAA